MFGYSYFKVHETHFHETGRSKKKKKPGISETTKAEWSAFIQIRRERLLLTASVGACNYLCVNAIDWDNKKKKKIHKTNPNPHRGPFPVIVICMCPW